MSRTSLDRERRTVTNNVAAAALRLDQDEIHASGLASMPGVTGMHRVVGWSTDRWAALGSK
jgi:hypothetical protein